ncbi:ribosomal protection-like ABC-F family protein [Lapidilactobacillus bayanensis]|uniref:ribosomal protection-like ABC-F family protein n=1 Tax=Lapidilactobacillus bayanensis TaxID=2485998 RepID=UPI000F788E05|nr:ABC-F type ribosomal protection protein [Lapidilactobacillus bayanensis]
MGSIKIVNLSFRYDDAGLNIFNHLNLDLDSSWKLGLVGRNGRGKTTFLNLLRKRLQGLGQIQTQLNFSYFPIEINNSENMTLYELQSQVSFEQWELERELNLLNVDVNLLWQPFKTLSGGEQTKVLLALSFIDQNSFPLIDEPTNHLDVSSRDQIAQYLAKHDRGYIVVSHDRDFLNQVTDHILAIENTEIHLYQGNYAAYEATKNNRDAFNAEKNQKLKGQIKSLQQKSTQFRNWSDNIEASKYDGKKTQAIINRRAQINKAAVGHAAEKMMRKALNVEHRLDRQVEAKKALMTNIEAMPDLTMNFKPDYHHVLLETKHFSLQIQDKKLFHDLNLQIKNHAIVSLEGKNGSGKSTFLKMLLGQFDHVNYQGKFELANGVQISYLPQNFVEYTGTLSQFAEKQQISYEALLNNLKKMGFPRASFTTKIEEMSMGQQKRVALAKSLVEPAALYLWDEPANYLDVFNQDQLIKLLKEIQPAMLLIEHDQYFIQQVASQRIQLQR